MQLSKEQAEFVFTLSEEQSIFLLNLPERKFNNLLKVRANDPALTKLDLQGIE